MSDPLPSYQGFLHDLRGPVMESFTRSSVLFEMIARDLAEAKQRDDEYLASLSPADRRRVLTQRRLDALQRRLDTWWEENMAWRFRPHRPDRYDEWGDE